MNASEIVLYILGSVGGIGIVFTAVIKFSSNFIAKRLEERYSLKLNKELEKYKSIVENKNYISKTKFDTEFEIYRSLSKTFFEMVKHISVMIPAGFSYQPADEKTRKERDNEIYKLASKACVEAQDTLNSSAPFISEELFNEYDNILKLCKLQLDAFERRWNVFYLAPQEEKESFTMEEYQRTREIEKAFNKLNNMVREYLSKLDVME
ncbi:hypothetical protein K280104A7_32320 [Candidatus Bariatricus faecipullorum]